MIVGYKTERYVTAQGHDYGLQLIGHEVVSELHSTKGWRRIKHRRQHIGPSKRHVAARALATGVTATFKPAYRRVPRLRVSPIPITEKMLMRHGWYRRKKAWADYRASLPAANVHPDFHTETQRKEAASGG